MSLGFEMQTDVKNKMQLLLCQLINHYYILLEYIIIKMKQMEKSITEYIYRNLEDENTKMDITNQVYL